MTILVGNSTQASTSSTNSPTGGQLDAQVFTASASGSTTSGSMYFGTAGITAYMCVYDDSTLALLGQSNAITTVVGWNPVTFSSAISIASGAAYILAFFTNATNIFGTDGGTGLHTKYTNLTTWPTAPATYSSDGNQSDTGNLAIYLSSSAPSARPGQFFFADAKIPGAALAMFMPLSWAIGRRNRRAQERTEERRIPVPRNRESP